MITRAQIRRQLRKEGGIMNVVPRQGYISGGIGGGIIQGTPMGSRTGYFNPFKAIKKGVKKVVDVGKQVIKSPVGKAALIGLGGAGLMGIGPFAGLSGIGARIGGSGIGSSIGRGLGALKSGLFGTAAGASAGPMSYLQKGVTPFTKGILGKLGLTAGGGKMIPTALGMISSASLLSYFTQKGATEEEAKELAQDVYRGKGLGMDQIKADMKNYRSGALSASQAHDRGYHFLTPRNYLSAQGGRVGLKEGAHPEKKTKREILEEEYPTLFSDTTTSIYGAAKINPKTGKPYKKKYTKGRKDGGRIGKYGGGIGAVMPRIPTGMPRVNAGGISELDYRQSGGFVPMGVKEKADDVPAMLSKNEFVMTADAVKAAGGGSVEKGAQRMYDTMKRLENRIA